MWNTIMGRFTNYYLVVGAVPNVVTCIYVIYPVAVVFISEQQ